MKKSALLISIIFVLACGVGLAQTTEFSYQGSLKNGANPASGNYDFEFALFDTVAGGTQLGSTVSTNNVVVTNGTFSVKLNFGNQFTGANRFLEIRVRQTGSGGLTLLSPRQTMTSSPYSVKSLTADNATNAVNATTATNSTNAVNATTATNSLQLGGVTANQYLTITGGNASYIQNFPGIGQQTASFNITGGGNANIFNATTQFNIGGNRILSSPGGDNVFAGRTAGLSNTSGIVNSFFGSRAGEANIGGSSNSFFGERSGLNSQGINNSFFGAVAGQTNVNGSNNTVIGTLADVGSPNLVFATAIGAGTIVSLNNTIQLGRISGADTVFVPGSLNVAGTFGSNIFNATTQYNIGGNRVLSVAGSFNIFAGINAGIANTTGFSNSFFGIGAGQTNTGGDHNSFFGESAGYSNTDSEYNSFFGSGAGLSNTIGNGNSFFGRQAGISNTIGSNNTLIGELANVSGDLNFATALGAGAIVATSNTVVLGRTADTVIAPNLLQVNVLGAAGSTSLCRNNLNQISTCTPGNFSEQNSQITKQQTQIEAQQKQIDEQNQLIKAQQEKLENAENQLNRQKLEFDALKMLVCSQNPNAELCKPKN